MSGTRNALAVAFSRHFMAVLPLRMHQIFMLAFAGLRVEGEEAQVLVVSQPPPLAFLMFLLSDCWEACATSLLTFFTDWVTNCIPAHRLSLFYPLFPTAALDRVEESLDYSLVFL